MSCPICLSPVDCSCAQKAAAQSARAAKSASVPGGAEQGDAEQYEPTEEQFAASLDSPASPSAPVTRSQEEAGEARFAAQTREPVKPGEHAGSVGAREPLSFSEFDVSGRAERLAQLRPARRAIVLGDASTVERTLEPGEWKQEVLSRVTRYRARRPRAERLRSLNLNFDPVTPFPSRPLATSKTREAGAAPIREHTDQAAGPPVETMTGLSALPENLNEPSVSLEQQAETGIQVDAFGVQQETSHSPEPAFAGNSSDQVAHAAVEPSEITAEQLDAEIIAKLGEAICAAEQRDETTFEESAVDPTPVPAVELAEPVSPASRVFQEEEIRQAELAADADMENTLQPSAPIATVDLLPTPEETDWDAETQFLPIAPLRQRAAMHAIDFGVSVAACLLFAAVLMWLGALPTGNPLVFMMLGLVAFFWSFYEYLLLVNTGTTLGMLLTGLQLTGFECRTVSRSRCRARALAMAVSTLALGVGFAWALLDLDGLSWHDRASGTFLTPRTE